VTVRKYGDLERNWLRGLVTSLGQQPSTHARTHARTMKALNLRARRNYIPFVCLFVCYGCSARSDSTGHGRSPPAAGHAVSGLRQAKRFFCLCWRKMSQPDRRQSIQNLVLWTLTHEPGMPFISKCLQTRYRGGPLGMHSSRMKGNFHVRLRGGESPRRGLPIPTGSMLGFVKSSTSRCS
jgi:hypothetical protein